MKVKHVCLVVLLVIPVLYGCGRGSPASGEFEPGFLSPSQVESHMVEQVVKVRGKILWVVENPGGAGGLYAQLGDDDVKVGVRIQSHIWETYSKREKARFREGNTITAEGVLVRAGGGLVVAVGKVPP
ncbi:hypothetical protein ACFLV4_07690 [Chloroflexota bacterium]